MRTEDLLAYLRMYDEIRRALGPVVLELACTGIGNRSIIVRDSSKDERETKSTSVCDTELPVEL